MSEGTKEALGLASPIAYTINENALRRIGSFGVLPFRTEHDAAQPFGFLITHPECGTVLFATDTYYLQYTFEGLNNILIECNYSQAILDANVDNGHMSPAMRSRIMKSHCSLATCKEILSANDLSNVSKIVLIHLSDGNSNATEFQTDISNATNKDVYIAESGMVISFNKTPF